MSLPNSFKPKKNFKLTRVGKDNDGGYLVGAKSLLISKTLISFGINNDWSFEKNFLEHNKVQLFCYDDVLDKKYMFYKIFTGFVKMFYFFKYKHFISSIDNFFDFFDFFRSHTLKKKRIDKNNFFSIISQKKVISPIFFKIDIEGSEYSLLKHLVKNKDKITGLVIEFHNINEHLKEIEKFIKDFDLELVHTHSNNFGKGDSNKDPTYIELTFEKYPEILNNNIVTLPHKLDQKNNPNDKEFLINFSNNDLKYLFKDVNKSLNTELQGLNALHILYSGLGGASSITFSLLKENQKNYLIKQDILFTGSYLFQDYKKRSKDIKNNYSYIKTINFLSFLSWFNVFLFLYKKKPDLIFLHNFQLVPVLFYKFIFKKKVVYIDHQSQNFLILKSFISALTSIKFFDFTIFVNKNKFLSFKNKSKNVDKKISHISNSVDANFFNNSHTVIKRKNFIIGMAARLDAGKRHELIIYALNHPKLKSHDITFLIAGGGDNVEYLKDLVKNEGLNNKVKFNGPLNEIDMKFWYKKLDLYVHATNGEGMSISILEAMAMKIPVIGSNVMGVKNLLNAKKNIGMLFENTIDDLATKIEFFYKSSKTEKILFKKYQRNFILDNHSSSIMFNNYKEVILKLLPYR